jgi:hypothetical protein
MTLYNVALFVHFIGVIVLFIAFGVGQRAGARMRGVGSVEHALLWLGLLKVTTPMFPTALLFLLGSGSYMAAEAWSFTTPWIISGIVAILLIGVAGTGVAIRGFGRMEAALEAATTWTRDLASVLNDTTTWTAIYAINGMSFAALWLMVVKPGWGQSVVLPTAFALIGGALGYLSVRRGIGTGVGNEAATDESYSTNPPS